MRFVTQHSIICIWSDYAFSGRCRWLGQLVSRNTSSTKGAKPSASDLKLDSLHNDFGSSTCMSWQTCRVFIVINPPKPVYTRLNGTLPKSGQRPIGSESATQGSRTTHSCVLSFQYVDDCKYAIHLVNGAVWDDAKPRGWIQISASSCFIEKIKNFIPSVRISTQVNIDVKFIKTSYNTGNLRKFFKERSTTNSAPQESLE